MQFTEIVYFFYTENYIYFSFHTLFFGWRSHKWHIVEKKVNITPTRVGRVYVYYRNSSMRKTSASLYLFNIYLCLSGTPSFYTCIYNPNTIFVILLFKLFHWVLLILKTVFLYCSKTICPIFLNTCLLLRHQYLDN